MMLLLLLLLLLLLILLLLLLLLFIYLFIYLFKVDKLVKILQNYYIKIAIPTCGMLIKVNYLS